MTGREAFEIWSPVGALWVDWVRPVPFAALGSSASIGISGLPIPQINYIDTFCRNTAIILDLPDSESIREGLALAKKGWRPIPLFNGSNPQAGTMAIVYNGGIESDLLEGARELKKIALPHGAPPVFLLDSNRLHRFKMNVSVFDNSWDIYSQDMPSAEYLLKNEIKKIIVSGNKIQKDLSKILYKYQSKGIKIFFTSGYMQPKEVSIKKPPKKQNN